jgi:hypothetical protein
MARLENMFKRTFIAALPAFASMSFAPLLFADQ